MTQHHPDLADEQAYIDHAYECLEQSREAAWKLRDLNEADLGGTFQARFERNAFDEALVKRLTDLDLGDAALVFGRIDRYRNGDDGAPDEGDPDNIEGFHIGRLAVADEDAEPVVVDWRAPVAEPFYRATGRDSMGLARRRHFAVEGRTLLGIEDELFGEGHLGLGHDEGLAESTGEGSLRGYSTLIASLERGRTGTLGDIVATIQAEQDEIIRSPQAGVLVVQGGPGTGKTVVALHRAAYLLYTHRFPLEDQGVLVIGPNRVFLKYIEQVLPSLGEAGIEQVVLGDLIPDVTFAPRGTATDSPLAERIKGDARMSDVIDHAVNDRERPLRDDLVVPFRSGYVRLRVDESARIVKQGRRRFRRHNSARRWVEGEVWAAMAATWRGGDATPGEVRADVRSLPEVREALERMWPVLTPAQLLHDLFGSMALLRLAAGDVFEEREYKALHRPRSESVDDVRWTPSDVALLDDAREVLGPQPGKGGKVDESDEIRTYGHIVIDEVQDLTPMQLKMATRRSLNGSMTVVGDIAQATGPMAPDGWDEVLEHLPERKPPRVIGLSVGYRIPAQIMDLANKVMAVATPGLRMPESVRVGETSPRVVASDSLVDGIIDEVRFLRDDMSSGSIAVVAPDELCDDISAAFTAAGLDHGRASSAGLDQSLTVVAVSVVKGLELDAVVVVEPSRVANGHQHGMRSLYVALTRSTQRLSIVHEDALPEPLR
ncbi:MAG: AAA family ATPase [Ilumatobacter sp.]|uniref:HelD family protein n=1 Tax=Ilumatobacter sp. TaxID=1967498 RepID=UPI00261FF5E6|nr:ATP-binding domain-containing protein [Ilumatobacter sp.]MDJ0769708.1 AAA family ATPase [Ilumatobacter sp.]